MAEIAHLERTETGSTRVEITDPAALEKSIMNLQSSIDRTSNAKQAVQEKIKSFDGKKYSWAFVEVFQDFEERLKASGAGNAKALASLLNLPTVDRVMPSAMPWLRPTENSGPSEALARFNELKQSYVASITDFQNMYSVQRAYVDPTDNKLKTSNAIDPLMVRHARIDAGKIEKTFSDMSKMAKDHPSARLELPR